MKPKPVHAEFPSKKKGCRGMATAWGGNACIDNEEGVTAMYLVAVDKNKCDGCGTCANVCPQSVFKMEGDKSEPVNMSECINCLTCVENCPQQAITVTEV